MFQHRILSTPTIDLRQNLPRVRTLRGLALLDDIVPLPRTGKGYLLFTLALTIVCGLAMSQVWTSLRITQSHGELAALRIQYGLIEQKNAELLWQIGQLTTLEQVQTRATQLNFHPNLKRKYVAPYSGAQNNLLINAEGPTWPADVAAEPFDSATDIAVAAQRHSLSASPTSRPTEARETTFLEEPLPRSAPELSPVSEFENFLSGWQQQVNERWQGGWRAIRQWADPLLERASDFFLGQLKQP